MVVTVTTFLDVFITLGFDIAFTRFYFDDKSEARRREVTGSTFYVKTVYPALLLGVVAVLMPYIAPLLLGSTYESGDWIYFDVALLTLFFENLNDLPFNLFRVEHRPWIFSSYTVGRVLVQVPLSVLFVAGLDWGPMGVLLANLITAASIQATLLPTYIRRVDWRLHRRLMRNMLAFAVPALFAGISFYWLKVSDRFFLLHYQGKAEVGLYTVANSLSQPLYLVLMAFNLAFPQWHLSRLEDPGRHKRLVARSGTYFMALNGMAIVLLGTYMPLLVHTLVSDRYWTVGPTTFVLTLSIALYALYYVFWVGSTVAKKNQLMPVFFAVASAVNIGLNFWLVPEYGMWAAAWTTVLGFLILVVCVYFYSEHWYPIPYEWGRLLRVLGATLASLGAAWGIAALTGQSVDMPYDELVVTSVLQIPALFVFPLVLWLTGFFTDGEREQVAAAWGKVTRGGPRGGAPAQAAGAAPDQTAAGAPDQTAAGAPAGADAESPGPYEQLSPEEEAELREEEEEELEARAQIDLAEQGGSV